MDTVELATVRGEKVHIISRGNEQRTAGVLGATVEGATVLVQYPDGERGYVKETDLREC